MRRYGKYGKSRRVKWSRNAVKAGANIRLAAAMRMCLPQRRDVWGGAIIMLGPIIDGRVMAVNLYCRKNRRRLLCVDSSGREIWMSKTKIIERIERRLQKLEIPDEY